MPICNAKRYLRQRIRRLGLALVVALNGCLHLIALGEPPPKNFVKQEEEYRSASQRAIVRVYRNDSRPLGTMQFRVFYEPGKDDDEKDTNTFTSKNGQVLWEGENRAWAEVSFDGEGIIINHHVLSDLGELIVFMRRSDGGYEKVDVNFQEEALKLLAKQEKMKKPPAFDHIYCYAETWLNEHTLIGHLEGHWSGESSLDPFWFIFDCKTRRFSFDLRDINKTVYHTREIEKGH